MTSIPAVADDRLEAIAKDIETLTATATLQIGAKLAEAREIFRYRRDEGGFAGWVETRLGCSRHTAYNLLHVHEQFGGQEVSKCLDTLGRSVLFLISAPSTPTETRDAILERAQNGESISVADVKQIIEKAKGVQPATKPPARTPQHVCWQCGRRGAVGEVKQHPCAQYDDAEVWLHDACVSAFDQAEQQREAAAERIAAPVDGENARLQALVDALQGENTRLQALVDALQAEKQHFEYKITRLEDELEDLKAGRQTSDVTMASLFNLGLPKFMKIMPAPWCSVLRNTSQLSARELVDLLERRLDHEGIVASAPLQKIRARIEQSRPQIDLTAAHMAGSA